MGRTLFLWLLLLSGINTFSQQRNFLYLQAESGSPFYVRLGEKTFSSTRTGHLIIPNLKDSNYLITIGLPGNRQPDLQFSLRMNTDKGFELRPKEGVRLSLFNWQNNNWTDPEINPHIPQREIDYSSMRTDPYSNLLAGIVNDSAVLFNTVQVDPPAPENESIAAADLPQKEPVQSDTSRQPDIVAKSDTGRSTENSIVLIEPGTLTEKPFPGLKDSLIASQEDMFTNTDTVRFSVEELTEKPSPGLRDSADSRVLPDEPTGLILERGTKKPVPVGKAASIRLINDLVQADQRELLYIDSSGSSADSIDIIIPLFPSDKLTKVPVPDTVNREPVSKTEKIVGTNEETPDLTNNEVLRSDDPSADSIRRSAGGLEKSGKIATAEPKKLVMINSDCRRFATELEIDKLRVAMLREEGDANRLKAAAKLFKSRCLTVQQVKALSELFSDDDGRFNFFEAVYPFVSDSGNFRFLEELLGSDFYRARFRSLLPG